TLTSRIYAARKAVGDNGHGQRLIRTVSRRGLRFVGDVLAQPKHAEAKHLIDPTPTDELRRRIPSQLPLPERPALAV
ncbi:winged helix-turn-helix domain-containing protein, partial [Enterococcus faecalis]|uniref:winged helix-turn-helix domain-containing protein n=1 Tax=Enterococcus faecalis TaxID=1351 RepID=UPI00403F556A